jgi:hypothetical protein
MYILPSCQVFFGEILCIFFYTFFLNLIVLPHFANLPAAYDVFAARISFAQQRPGLQKSGGGFAREWSVAE